MKFFFKLIFHYFQFSMDSSVQKIVFPFISEPFRKTVYYNPAIHGQTWDFPLSPKFHGKRAGGGYFGRSNSAQLYPVMESRTCNCESMRNKIKKSVNMGKIISRNIPNKKPVTNSLRSFQIQKYSMEFLKKLQTIRIVLISWI